MIDAPKALGYTRNIVRSMHRQPIFDGEYEETIRGCNRPTGTIQTA